MYRGEKGNRFDSTIHNQWWLTRQKYEYKLMIALTTVLAFHRVEITSLGKISVYSECSSSCFRKLRCDHVSTVFQRIRLTCKLLRLWGIFKNVRFIGGYKSHYSKKYVHENGSCRDCTEIYDNVLQSLSNVQSKMSDSTLFESTQKCLR